MKTTLDINDQLLAEATAFAAREYITLNRLVEEGLRLRLRAHTSPRLQGKVRLPVFEGRGGLVVGVDPLSNKVLLGASGDEL